MARSEAIASTAPAAPIMWPVRALIEETGTPGGALAEQTVDGEALGLVVQRGAGAVRVHVVDLRGRYPGAGERVGHGAERSVPLRVRTGDVVGVAGEPEAVDEAERRGAARPRARLGLDHDRARSFSEQQSGPAEAERPADVRRHRVHP